jgi:uncharacterized protein (TIGR00251 family)
MRLTVKVVPRSSKNEVGKIMANGSLKIKLSTAPVDGKANEELKKVLAEYFSCSKNDIFIISGKTSTKKVIEIKNL